MPLNKEMIFCIGMNKTGTTTLHVALSLLGYNSTHYHFRGQDPEEGWVNYIQNSNYDAFSDWPMCRKGFFKTLAAAFPEAKFILTVRKDTAAWTKSAEQYFRFTPYWYLYEKGKPLNSRIQEYEDHNKEVRDFFRGKMNFLELAFDGGDARWEKLCGFLKKEIPSVDFPHLKPKTRIYSKVIVQRIKIKARNLINRLWRQNAEK